MNTHQQRLPAPPRLLKPSTASLVLLFCCRKDGETVLGEPRQVYSAHVAESISNVAFGRPPLTVKEKYLKKIKRQQMPEEEISRTEKEISKNAAWFLAPLAEKIIELVHTETAMVLGEYYLIFPKERKMIHHYSLQEAKSLPLLMPADVLDVVEQMQGDWPPEVLGRGIGEDYSAINSALENYLKFSIYGKIISTDIKIAKRVAQIMHAGEPSQLLEHAPQAAGEFALAVPITSQHAIVLRGFTSYLERLEYAKAILENHHYTGQCAEKDMFFTHQTQSEIADRAVSELQRIGKHGFLSEIAQRLEEFIRSVAAPKKGAEETKPLLP